MKSAIVIRHIAFEDLGSLADALDEQDYTFSYLEAGLSQLAQIDPLAPDLLVILGGPIGAYDESEYPFLLDELYLLKQRLNADRPTIGICLGAQLMARALGAKVYPGWGKEIGWFPLELTAVGKTSPLAHLALPDMAVLHWHGDTFDLPSGAIHLASTAKYQNQAFAWGRRCLALQFHPEVTQPGLERWFIGHAGEINSTPDISVTQLREATAKYAQMLSVQAAAFWQELLHSVSE